MRAFEVAHGFESDRTRFVWRMTSPKCCDCTGQNHEPKILPRLFKGPRDKRRDVGRALSSFGRYYSGEKLTSTYSLAVKVRDRKIYLEESKIDLPYVEEKK